MPRRAQGSTGGAWTDAEKYRVMFSLMNANGGKIDWASAYIPPGRTLKAVRHMIEGEKKKFLGDETEDDGAVSNAKGSAAVTPVKQRSTGKAAAKSTPQSATKRKRATKSVEDEVADDEDVKRVKEELEDVADALVEGEMDA